MLRAFERAFSLCKSGDLRVDLFPTAHDPLKRPLPRTVLWIGLSFIFLFIAFALDDPIARIFTLGSSDLMRHLAVSFSKAGEGWVVGVAGATCSLFLFCRGRFVASRGVFLVALTGLLTGAAATLIRSVIGRTRPGAHELQGFYGVWHNSHWIIGKYEFGAFPSGHVATVIGLAAAAWLLDRRFGLVALVYALLVSWSRIAMGCHHFSDEVAAAILAIYGANLILARLGPTVYCVGEHLENAWLARKDMAHSSSTPE